MSSFISPDRLRKPKYPDKSQTTHDGTDIVAAEPLFRRMLLLERRRCERAESRFALMLLDLEELTRTPDAPRTDDIAAAIAGAVRETDITGWYEPSSTIGVIFTEFATTDRPTLETVTIERIKRALARILGPAQLELIRISCHFFPDDDSGGISNSKPGRMFHSNNQKKDSERKYASAIKRAVDVAGSLAALIVLTPFFIIIPIVIKLTSPGPVFFRQARVGQFGQLFTFLKFRSMYVNSDPTIHKEYVRGLIDRKGDHSGGTYKIKNDPRVTAVGRLLRKTSLDEFPQFINVLRGEMSLVGPRPPIPYEFESYSLWHRRRILEAKPGITGAWQVDGRSRTTFDEMVRMDLRYIRNQSLLLDTKILLKTPFAVVRGDGAY
jgi:lipopolysaccharide/colanic/teichoic acid biosynthesis glycosyltransferase